RAWLVHFDARGRPGACWDGCWNGAADAGDGYVMGNTASTDFPTTTGGFQPTSSGGGDKAFVTKLNPSGSGLVYSTYLGGSVLPWWRTGISRYCGRGSAVDASGTVYLTGVTDSAHLPTPPV